MAINKHGVQPYTKLHLAQQLNSAFPACAYSSFLTDFWTKIMHIPLGVLTMSAIVALFCHPVETEEEWWTDQWRRRVCRNAESPSMTSRMATVSTAHGTKSTKMSSEPTGPPTEKPRWSIMFHSTSDSSVHTYTQKYTQTDTHINRHTHTHRNKLWCPINISTDSHSHWPQELRCFRSGDLEQFTSWTASVDTVHGHLRTMLESISSSALNDMCLQRIRFYLRQHRL